MRKAAVMVDSRSHMNSVDAEAVAAGVPPPSSDLARARGHDWGAGVRPERQLHR